MHSHLSRRQALRAAACGFGSLALAGFAQRTPHYAARAKRVIFLFMQGGPSQVDTFDHKPRLAREHGQLRRFDDPRIRALGKEITTHRVMKSPWAFRQHGACGGWVSDLLPHLARHIDDLCVLRGMHTDGAEHGLATLFLHTGASNLVRPSVGSWVLYGLGTENQSLPGFLSICPSMGKGGPRTYGNAFLPAVCQGTPVGRAGIPSALAKIRNLGNGRQSRADQREQLDALQALNAEQAGDSEELHAALESFELAFRMQDQAPALFDLDRESRATRALYGIGDRDTDDFGRQCLTARRLVEAGVRFVQLTYGDNKSTPGWDQHTDLAEHALHARATDQPIAGLLTDLKQRGLLHDTLVWWGGEFGRTPYTEKDSKGRDHNPEGFTMWLAGGGVKGGLAHGQTDEYGQLAVEGKVHMHDLHATILHLLGLDHEKLTYRHAGRDFRLTDVHGEVVRAILT